MQQGKKEVETQEWKVYEEGYGPGKYIHEDLESLRVRLRANGTIPRGCMASVHKLRALHWDGISVYQAPED